MLLACAMMSKRAYSSFSVSANCWAVHLDAMAVKPLMSAKRILQQRDMEGGRRKGGVKCGEVRGKEREGREKVVGEEREYETWY